MKKEIMGYVFLVVYFIVFLCYWSMQPEYGASVNFDFVSYGLLALPLLVGSIVLIVWNVQGVYL